LDLGLTRIEFLSCQESDGVGGGCSGGGGGGVAAAAVVVVVETNEALF